MCSEILQQICLSPELNSMTHGYATQARCFHVKYTHRYILNTHTTMRYRCEILNHGIHGYGVWLHDVTRGTLGLIDVLSLCIQLYTPLKKQNCIRY